MDCIVNKVMTIRKISIFVDCMKKHLFFLTLIAITLLTGCSKDNGPDNTSPCPVTGIELPESSTQAPVTPGSTITIQGNGFASDCEIWLYAVEAAKTTEGVQAEIENVTSASLSFIAPSVAGLQSVELRQDGGTWRLGELTFPAEKEDLPFEILPKRISHIRVTWIEDMTFVLRYTYDTEGCIIAITKTDQQSDYEDGPFEDEVTSIEYASDRIIVTEPEGSQLIHTLTNGRTTSIAGISNNGSYPDNKTFLYDANGYIAESTWAENPDPSVNGKCIYTVRNGNLVHMDEKYYGFDEEESTDEYISFENAHSHLNNLNIDLFGICYFGSETHLDDIYLFGVGGKRFRTLPVRVDYDGDEIIDYRYTMDGEYISQIEQFDEYGELSERLEFFYDTQASTLYGTGIRENHSVIYRIDRTNGSTSEFAALNDGEYLNNAVTIPGSGAIFGIARKEVWGDGAVCQFDPISKTYRTLTGTLPGIEMLGVAGSKLYALCTEATGNHAAGIEVSLVEIDPQTGAIDKMTFDGFMPNDAQNIEWSDHSTMVYDPQNNRLLTTPYIYDGENEDAYLLTFDLVTRKVTLGERLASNVDYLFRKGNGIYAACKRTVNYGTDNERAITDLYAIDQTNLKLGSKIGGDIPDDWFGWCYDTTDNVAYCLTEKNWETQTFTIGVYKWADGSFRELSENAPIQNLVLIE